MQLGDLDLLDLLVLLNLLELDILNNWLNVSRFNKTDWTANRPDGIKDKTTSDVKGLLRCQRKKTPISRRGCEGTCGLAAFAPTQHKLDGTRVNKQEAAVTQCTADVSLPQVTSSTRCSTHFFPALDHRQETARMTRISSRSRPHQAPPTYTPHTLTKLATP